MNGAEARVIADANRDEATGSASADVEVSSKAIASVDDLAELILTNADAKREAIRLGGLEDSKPTDHATVLAGRLLARNGTERAVRKILDAAPEVEVIDTLSGIVWQGQEASYVLARPDEEIGALREAVLCLTTLVVAHLEKGPKGVDSVASSTPLLKLRPAKEEIVRRAPRTITDSYTQALIEQIAMSGEDDEFVVLGDDLVAMPARAADALVAQWNGWMHVAKDREFNVAQSVGLTPCLPSGVRQLVVEYLRQSVAIRLLEPRDAPPLANVAHCISRLPSDKAKQTVQRVHAVFFKDQYRTVDDFLMACLGKLLKVEAAS